MSLNHKVIRPPAAIDSVKKNGDSDHRKRELIYTIAAVAVVMMISSNALADGGTAGPTGTFTNYRPETPPEGQWDDFLPILGKAAHAKGFDLPRPFGIGIIGNYTDRATKVSDLSIGLDNPPDLGLDDYVELDPHAQATTVLGRVDMWLLPFFNIYGFGGYVSEHSTTKVTVSGLPRPFPQEPFTFDVSGHRTGPTYGGGGNLVGGWRKFFFSANANYAESNLSFDSNIDTLITSIRGGWHGDIGRAQVQFWGGVSHWRQTRTVSDSLDLPGGGKLNYRIEQEPVNDITGIVGFNINLPKNFTFMVETEFAPHTFLISGGPSWRF